MLNINFVIAHSLEAKPLIQYFEMQKLSDSPTIYGNKSGMRLVVCGEGFQCAVDGVNVLKAEGGSQVRAWLNIGIAGHQSLDVGQSLVANKIVHQASRATVYPIPIDHQLMTGELHTVDAPELSYPDDVAYDMEAFPFFQAASKFTTLELIQSLKLISDNPRSNTDRITKESVLGIFHQNERAIEEIVGSLEVVRSLYELSLFESNEFESIESALHLTATQKSQVRRLCQRMEAYGLKQELQSLARKEELQKLDGRALVASLTAILKTHEQSL